jgi:hypothetical protein
MLFVGGTVFAERPKGEDPRHYWALHPVANDPKMDHLPMIVGRFDEWEGPEGAGMFPNDFKFLKSMHPELKGDLSDYWLYCPKGQKFGIGGGEPFTKRAERLLPLTQAVPGEVVDAPTLKHAHTWFILKGGTLTDGKPVNERSARHWWEFDRSGGRPYFLSDVTIFTVIKDSITLKVSKLDGSDEAEYELPAKPISLYIFNLPKTIDKPGPTDIIHHHKAAASLYKAQGVTIPTLFSRTRGKDPSETIGFTHPCAASIDILSAPPDTEFCVNSEM